MSTLKKANLCLGLLKVLKFGLCLIPPSNVEEVPSTYTVQHMYVLYDVPPPPPPHFWGHVKLNYVDFIELRLHCKKNG